MRSDQKSHVLGLFAAGAVAALTAPVAARAQETEERSGLAEVVVTAEKREESLQDTPISIAAFDAKALEVRRVTSLLEIAAGVPNLQVAPGAVSPNSLRIIIRGIGQLGNEVTRDAPVAVYQDGVYLGRIQGMGNELAELERVEVLRGPQGTLYGRNATAGAINFITKAPELHELSFEQKLTFGNFDEFRSRSTVNVPIGDTLAFGFTFLKAQRHGFVRNIGTGEPRFGDLDRDAVRGAVLWAPSNAFEARYTYDSAWIDDTANFAAVVPFYPPKAERPRTGSPFVRNLRPNDTHIQGHNLTVSYNFLDGLTLKSITGYRRLDGFEYQDFNSGVLGPFAVSTIADTTGQKQFSEELQAIGKALDGRLEYIAGLYYFKESGDGFSLQTTPVALNPRTVTFKNSAYAVFAQGTFTPALLDKRLHLTAGARWSKDEREASVLSVSNPNVGPSVTLIRGSGERSFDDFSPTWTVQFDINDDMNVYAKTARAYKSGGFNPTASSQATFARGFGPETLISYEAGIKSELLDRRLRVNAAAFYNRYKDIQTNVFDPDVPRIFDIINAGRAVTKGFEADVTALLVEGLTVRGSYGYVDAKYTKVVDLGGNDITERFVFPHAPKSSFSASADYTSPKTLIGTFYANVSYDWQGKFISLGTDRRFVVAANGLLNATFGLSDVGGREGLRVAVWGRNLTDETYYLSTFPAGATNAFFGFPRTYGIDATVKF